MALLDVFKQDLFGVISLTSSVNKLPFQPARIGSMGLFQNKPITTTTALVEERHGKLALIQTSARGTRETALAKTTKEGRAFKVPHIDQQTIVFADDVQGVRQFGSEDRTQPVANLVNEKMTELKQNIEVTLEHMRVGCIHGNVLDADGVTTIFNWFTEFGIAETTINIQFGVDTVKTKATEVLRAIEDALGAVPLREVRAICGDNYFDALIEDADVKAAFERPRDGAFLREQQFRVTSFEYGGIIWENYRGSVGGVAFVDTDEARFFPVGVPGLFQQILAPADYMEAVNTPGKPFYAKQERMKFDVGVEIEVQSNPLLMCNRPAALIKGTKT